MKKILILLMILGLTSVSLFSQVNFSGSADIAFTANIPEAADYSSIFDPVGQPNVMGLKDIGISSSFIAKLDAGDEKTTFSAWFALKEYPIGQALLAAAYDVAEDFPTFSPEYLAVGDLVAVTGDTIFSLDLMRLSTNVYLSDNFSMEVGRQSMLTGYGYGWNPIDFANPLKNPTDPDAAMRGVDGLSFKIYMGNIAALKIYGILPRDILTSGLDFEEIKTGGELTFNFPGFEWKLAGFYDYDNSAGSDAYTPSIGTGFMADLFGIGFYGEGALRKGSRNNFTDGGAGLSRKSEWLFSALAGLEYTFGFELYAVLEYFYNGEGYNKAERSLFEASLTALGGTSDLFSIYSPGYFAQHYIMINLMQPLYDINTDLNFSAMFSPDSGALTLMPSVMYSFSANFSGQLAYVGMFDLYSSDFSEVTGLPVKHVINTVFTYSY